MAIFERLVWLNCQNVLNLAGGRKKMRRNKREKSCSCLVLNSFWIRMKPESTINQCKEMEYWMEDENGTFEGIEWESAAAFR